MNLSLCIIGYTMQMMYQTWHLWKRPRALRYFFTYRVPHIPFTYRMVLVTQGANNSQLMPFSWALISGQAL